MKIGRIILYVIILFMLKVVSGTYIHHFSIYNESNRPVKNVEMIGWRCSPYIDPACTAVDRNYPFSMNQIPILSGATNEIEYEERSGQNDPDYYIEYIYAKGYQTKVFVGQDHTINTGPPGPGYTLSYTLVKKDNCAAVFTPNIYSCAEQGIPLSILTDTNLDLDTASAFGPYDYYWPDELSDWDRVDTQMMVDIRKSGTGQPSVSGYPQYQTAEIYGGETHKFEFVWETSKNTVPGVYYIEMESQVIDEKCDQTNDQVTTHTSTVEIKESLDGCRADVNNFKLATSSPSYDQDLHFLLAIISMFTRTGHGTAITATSMQL
jgi:hypothetical protein